MIRVLDRETLVTATRELASRDPHLAAIVERYGPAPLWDREPGFATLLHIVLEQQVSLASAQAAFDRLRAAIHPLTPERFLALGDAELLEIGFSRQKTRYGRALATALVRRELVLEDLDEADDDAVRGALQALPGIGTWTSTIYLLMVLGRPDEWPTGDLALATAVRDALGLDRRPDPDELASLGDAWRPWRSVAARLFWHDYLCRRGRPG